LYFTTKVGVFVKSPYAQFERQGVFVGAGVGIELKQTNNSMLYILSVYDLY